ncbi:MAG: hypothetical protein HP497_12785 [Nitrospira sp.]|nr:hypothetical protein [Nitrospira sp.]
MKGISIVACALLIAGPVLAQTAQERREFMKLRPDVQMLVTIWLNQSCSVKEQQKIATQLGELGVVLEPVFWEAYRLGPAETEVRELQVEFRMRYVDRQRYLQEVGERLFDKEQLQELLKTTEQQYVQRETGQYFSRYKAAALAGIGVVGRISSELETIAKDMDSPVQGAAQEAIKAIAESQQRR